MADSQSRLAAPERLLAVATAANTSQISMLEPAASSAPGWLAITERTAMDIEIWVSKAPD